jgi:hypothetical protein
LVSLFTKSDDLGDFLKVATKAVYKSAQNDGAAIEKGRRPALASGSVAPPSAQQLGQQGRNHKKIPIKPTGISLC